MADVTGDLGGQPIQLNNASTEATLKEILAAILKQGVTGKGGKSQKELEKKLQELAKATEELTDEQKAAIKKQDEINKKKEEEIKQAKELGEAYRGLLGAATSLITGMTNMISTLSRLDNSMTAAASSLSAFGPIGSTLATVFGAVTGAAERTYKAFQQAASVGANFGGSITDMINAASGAGLTFDQFSGIVSRTGSDLALLGGSTAEGAKRLARLGKEIKDSPLSDELARMGYTTEQINESMAKYSGIMAKTGSLQGMSNSQLVAQTGQYLQNLDAVSKLTGLNKKDLEDQRNQMMKDSQIRNTLRKMDATSQEELMAFLQTLPAELQEGAKEVIATGTATTEAGKAALQYLPDSGRAFMQMNAQIRQTGTFTKENNKALNASIQAEAKRVADSPLAENMRLYGDKYAQGVFTAIDDVAAREKTIGQVQAESAKAAQERAKKEKENVDAANLKKFQEQIAQVSNTFTAFLANSSLLTDFQRVFTTMVGFVETFVLPTFSFLADNAGIVALVLAPLVGLIGLTSLAMSALTLQTNLETLAKAGGIKMTLKQTAASLASALGLGKVAMAALAAALPFLKFLIPVLLLIGAFKALYNAGFTVGDVFEAVGDGMKKLMITLADGFLWLLDKVTFGDANKKIKQAQRALDLEREELKEKEKARDQRRKDKRAERGIQEQDNKLSKEALELQQKENEAKKEGQTTAPTTPGGAYDLSSPQKMFESAMRRQQGAAAQPGAAAVAPGLGGMSAQFESGTAGTSAVGFDSTGGTSFGKYQIATRTGTMDKFMEHLKKTNPEAFDRLTKAGPADSGKDGAFAQEWKKLSGEGKLQESEHDFIKKTHYDVGVGKVKDKNLQDMIGKSKALQEVMFSTSVQHGGGGAGSIFNKSYKEGMTEQDLIKAIYAERSTKFGSSTGAVQQSVMNRFAQEQQLALGLVGQPETAATESVALYGDGSGKGSATPTAAAARTGRRSRYDSATPTAAAAQTAMSPPQAPPQAPPQTQENPTTLLSSLNTKMDTLIALNRRANDTRDSQLKAAKTSAGEVTAWVGA